MNQIKMKGEKKMRYLDSIAYYVVVENDDPRTDAEDLRDDDIIKIKDLSDD